MYLPEKTTFLFKCKLQFVQAKNFPKKKEILDYSVKQKGYRGWSML